MPGAPKVFEYREPSRASNVHHVEATPPKGGRVLDANVFR